MGGLLEFGLLRFCLLMIVRCLGVSIDLIFGDFVLVHTGVLSFYLRILCMCIVGLCS